ncbi:MAG TPA: hypothetical protein PK413_02120 [Thermoanaerobaculia bacterium]|nr:hypothetical protein [Thermoanaerobaculia bacterium]
MSQLRNYPLELRPYHFDYLAQMARKYDLPDEGKALRCLINFAIEESGREKEIFEEIRCRDC